MRRVIFLLITCCFYQFSFTQSGLSDVVEYAGHNLLYIHCKAKKDADLNSIYLDDKWNWGSVMLKDTSKVILGYPIKYDILNGIIEIKSREGIKIIEDYKLNAFSWVDEKGKEFFFINSYEYNYDFSNKMLRVLVDGPTKLFKEIRFVKQEKEIVRYGVQAPTSSVRKISNYYLVDDNGATLIHNKKKDLLKYIDKKSDEVRNYVNKYNLRYSNDNDLIKILEYYNSII